MSRAWHQLMHWHEDSCSTAAHSSCSPAATFCFLPGFSLPCASDLIIRMSRSTRRPSSIGVRDLKSQSKRNSGRMRTSRLSSSHFPYPSLSVMHRRKRSSSSLKSLPRLLPYLSVRLSHAFSTDLTLAARMLAISSFSTIFFSPSSMRLTILSKSGMLLSPSRQKASEYARTSSTDLVPTSSAISGILSRPCRSAPLRNLEYSPRVHWPKPAASSPSRSLTSAISSGVVFSSGTSPPASTARCAALARFTSRLYSAS
mmetsp:Transcript_29314/g.94495  ORF Transcript_29314/g.94495 Transcript_29314/m.94495 type:complete len:257 (+) Transcript_29314:792-1562(+)